MRTAGQKHRILIIVKARYSRERQEEDTDRLGHYHYSCSFSCPLGSAASKWFRIHKRSFNFATDHVVRVTCLFAYKLKRRTGLQLPGNLLPEATLASPDQALPEILAAWRRCEEELLTLLQDEANAEAEADEIAEKRLSGVRGNGDIPGGFQTDQPALIQGQPRRKEVGRASRADGEAPMGLFEVARGAAQALGRMGQGGKQPPSVSQRPQTGDENPDATDGGDRVRKRDVVANAVTGGMVKGIGWMLGATPADEQNTE